MDLTCATLCLAVARAFCVHDIAIRPEYKYARHEYPRDEYNRSGLQNQPTLRTMP